MDIHGGGEFGAAAFAVDVGNGSIKFELAFVGHHVFKTQRQIGAGTQWNKAGKYEQDIFHIVVLLGEFKIHG